MSPKSRRGADLIDPADIEEWFTVRLPVEWFSAVTITSDRDEVLVVGTLIDTGGSETACVGRITQFREETRQQRIAMAADAEERFQRKVSWGARCGDVGVLFTHLSIPAMTRLRIQERRVLDTLVEGGVARSRSDALAWCVRLVGRNTGDWLEELQAALGKVEEVRRKAPDS
jgi:hypothetical protein